MEKISVAVRIRPPSSSESSKCNYWKVVDNTISLCSPLGTPVSGQTFAFDHVFGVEVGTAAIYDLHTKGVITSALHGFNGTVFAYGQTSSGKTYTMRGSKDSLGLIGLSVHEVFRYIQKVANREFLIRVSYMEIYNEDINDLFAPENRKLQVHENLDKGIFVAGLREEIVSSPEQVFELLELGEAHRHFGQTNMNVYSSRSHTIFRMVIESKDKHVDASGACPLDAVRVSVLNLVDLAGSERVAKTGAGGVRLKEGTHINKSLMTLGNVIKKLSDGAAKQGGHIPYRDSKLTRILQPALGGNAKTAIICTIAPEEIHIDETRGTLLFASRAKRVMTCAQVNEILTDAALLKRQQREIEDLRRKLKGLQSDVSDQEILRLRNDLLKYELEKERLELELQEERKAQLEREQRIKEQELKIENLSSLVITSSFDDAVNKENGKHLENRPIHNAHHNDLVTVRREMHRSPLNFDIISRSAERNGMHFERAGDLPELQNFANVADEDLWATMNDGQPLTEPEFLFSTPSRWASSVGSTKRTDSSSVISVLMNSRNKMEKYKYQLEEMRSENLQLRAQLQEQLSFQAELEREFLNLQNEFAESSNVSQIMDAMWDTINQAKSHLTSVIRNIGVTEKPQLQSDIMRALKDKSFQVESLAAKVGEVEEQLSRVGDENIKLRSQCQMLESLLQKRHANVDKVSETPDTSTDCTVERFSQESSPLQKRLSNGSHVLSSKREGGIGSQQGIAQKMPEVDVLGRHLSKDHGVRISHDDGCERRGGSMCRRITDYVLKYGVPNCEKSTLISEGHVDGVLDGSVPNDVTMTEMLLMCREHVRVLEKQVLLANLAKDRATSALKEQVDAYEKSVAAMKLEKRRFAEDIKKIMEAIAMQDDFVTSICHGIEECDKAVGLGHRNSVRQLSSAN